MIREMLAGLFKGLEIQTGTIQKIPGGSNIQIHDLADGSAANDAVNKGQLDLKIDLTEKGANSGVATLDSGGKVPISQLPNSVMEYKGAWNANTNSPTLANGSGNAGDVYRVDTAGTTDFGAGGIAFVIGDYAIYSGTVWEKSHSGADAIITVNGQAGVVQLDAADIPYDNATSGLTATDTQAAIDEVVVLVEDVDARVDDLDAIVIKKDGSVAFEADLDMGGNKIVGLAEPENDDEAATKAYVDDAVVAVSGANTALSNLTTTSINQALLPSADVTHDIGSASLRWNAVIANSFENGTGRGSLSLATGGTVLRGPTTNGSVRIVASGTARVALEGAQGAVADLFTVKAAGEEGEDIGFFGSDSGVLIVQSLDVATGNTAEVTVASGDAADGNSGNINLTVGTASDSRGSINLDALSVSTVGATTFNSRQIDIRDSGDGAAGSLSVISSQLTLASSSLAHMVVSAGGGNHLYLQTEDASGFDSGNVLISSGSTDQQSGNIQISTGAGSLARGDISITADDVTITADQNVYVSGVDVELQASTLLKLNSPNGIEIQGDLYTSEHLTYSLGKPNVGWNAVYSPFFIAPDNIIAFSGDTTEDDAVVLVADTSDLSLYMDVFGAGIIPGSFILAINPNVSITLSIPATATASAVSLTAEYAATLQSADRTDANPSAGAYVLSGYTYGASGSGPAGVFSGDVFAATGGSSGPLYLFSGVLRDADNDNNSGDVYLGSGSVNGTGTSGSVNILAGSGASRGNVNIQGAGVDVTAATGNVEFNAASGEIFLNAIATNIPYGSELRFIDSGSAYVGFKAPETMSETGVYTLPDADGEAGQVLKTDGALTLSWGDAIPASSAQWVKVSVNYAQLAAAAATNSYDIMQVGEGRVIQGVIVKHSAAFAGGDLSAYTVEIGVTGETDKFASAFDVFQAPGNTVGQVSSVLSVENFVGAVTLYATATAVGDDLDAATAGSVDIWVLIATLP